MTTMRKRAARVRVPFVVTTAALIAGCGGSTEGEAGTGGGSGGTAENASAGAGGSMDSGGAGGSGAAGSGGFGGSAGGSSGGFGASGGFGGFGGSAGYGGSSVGGGSGECPPEPPVGSSCEGVGAGTQCEYSVECESGQQPLGYTCSAQGLWALDHTACSKPWDSCLTQYVQCRNGEWYAWGESPNSNPPPPCPAERPEAESSCAEIQTIGGVPTCGYYCDDGQTWTVAGCTLDELQWELDGSCSPNN